MDEAEGAVPDVADEQRRDRGHAHQQQPRLAERLVAGATLAREEDVEAERQGRHHGDEVDRERDVAHAPSTPW